MDINYEDLYVRKNFIKNLKIFQNTKIGKTINNLTRNKDERIKDLSNKLLISWKKIVKNNKTNSNGVNGEANESNKKDSNSKINLKNEDKDKNKEKEKNNTKNIEKNGLY